MRMRITRRPYTLREKKQTCDKRAGPCHLAKDNMNAEGAGRIARFRQFPKRAEQTQTDPQTR